MNLYEKLAEDIEQQVRLGVIRTGEKIPSVRQLSKQLKISVTTVVRGYLLLESRGVIESRPQSGYFVRRPFSQVGEHTLPPKLPASAHVDISTWVLSTLKSLRNSGAIPFGAPYPNPALFPSRKLLQHAHSLARRLPQSTSLNDLPPGNPVLIRQIARRYLESGMPVDPEAMVITFGATEALNLCLQAVAKPGDSIAVESPTFFAILQAIERLGMRAVEIPCRAGEGIDIGILANLLKQKAVTACMVMPNFQNPSGLDMPDDRKRELVELAASYEMPIIEDAVYNELYYGDRHPQTLKTYDRRGLVLHCSSFSKCLSEADRIGWALAGRFHAKVERLKFINTLTMPSLPQLAVAEYLTSGGYDFHLRRLRKGLAQRARIMRSAVERFFPRGTTVFAPTGGYTLWVELPGDIDTLACYQSALDRDITYGPGKMFSASGAHTHCIRLNYSYPWTPRAEAAIVTLGGIFTPPP